MTGIPGSPTARSCRATPLSPLVRAWGTPRPSYCWHERCRQRNSDLAPRSNPTRQVLEQMRHPLLRGVPLLSALAAGVGPAGARGRHEMSRLTHALGLVADDDHRVAAANLQGQRLDDAWAALLGSTLETNGTVTAVNLNE